MAKSTSKLFEEETSLPEVVDETVEEKKAAVVEMPASKNDDIQDIDMSIIKKQKFRINGDNNKIIELNVSDMGIARRLTETYDRLNKLMEEVADKFNIEVGESDEDMKKIADALDEIDKKMGAELDYLFNANIYEVFKTDGSMWDPIEGAFRYEHIIDRLSALYENNLNKEFSKMKKRISDRTSKYTKVKARK